MEFTSAVERVVEESISEYARETYNRAFADRWDGMKPVHRRILYTMFIKDVFKMTKVANVVGMVMTFHPHGDSSIYEALVGLAQKFRMNYPLVDGQGNFGTIAGDPPSAARYIECKLSKFAQEVLLDDLNGEVVDFQLNYDRRELEPMYLPTKLPIVLINGLSGVGEAFSMTISPHNLNDVVDMVIKYIENPTIKNETLVEGIFPDFPTGGYLMDSDQVSEMYKSGGTGSMAVRARVRLDQTKGVISIDELPYKVTFKNVQDAILNLRSSGDPVLSGIVDVAEYADEKNRDSGFFSFDIICKKGLNLADVLDRLYKRTPLESKYLHMPFLNYRGAVKPVTIKDIIAEWVKIRKLTIRRKFTFAISRAENERHVLEGIYIIYDNLADVIKLVTSSKRDRNGIIFELMDRYDRLTEIQATAIVDRKLYTLSSNSKENLERQIKSKSDEIEEYRRLISNVDLYIIREVTTLKEKYGRDRRTTILGSDVVSNQDSRRFTYGSLLHTQYALGYFDIPTLLVSGRKILSGLKPINLLTGSERQVIRGGSVVGSNANGCIIFYSDGSAERKVLDDFPVFNTWIHQDFNPGEMSITQVVPVSEDTKWIFIVNEERKIRRVEIDAFGNRKLRVGMCDFALAIDDEEDEILCVNQNGLYFCDVAKNIPIFGRTSAGVKTNFSEADSIFGLIPNRVQNTAISIFLTDGEDSYLHTIKHTKIRRIKRTNTYKMIVGSVNKIRVIGLMDIPHMSKEPILVIGENSILRMALRHFKPRKNPTTMNIKPITGVQIVSEDNLNMTPEEG